MLKTIIVADDMTGANVSNSLLAKNGLTVGTLIASGDISNYTNFDALGVHTDSRGFTQQEAYDNVYKEVKSLSETEVAFYNKRIDSTLRGNLGAETDAILDALDDDEIAIVVPSFPNSGKIVIGNYMLVNGEPLEKTDVANDPTTPVKTSQVAEVFKQQTKYEIGIITISSVLHGYEYIAQDIKALCDMGKRIIIIDACTNDDILEIAKATLSLKKKFVSVDPGPFTEALVKELAPKSKIRSKQKLLFVIGSVSTVAISQIANLRAEHDPYVIKINTTELVNPASLEQEKNRIVSEVCQELENQSMFLLATRIESKDKLDLPGFAKSIGLSVQDVSEKISQGVAEIADAVIEKMGDQIGGIYTSGGDITQAVLNKTKTLGIEIKDEIIPLAVYGRIMNGKLDQKAIITKGGLIGDEHTLVQCADYMYTKLSTTYSENTDSEAGDL